MKGQDYETRGGVTAKARGRDCGGRNENLGTRERRSQGRREGERAEGRRLAKNPEGHKNKESKRGRGGQGSGCGGLRGGRQVEAWGVGAGGGGAGAPEAFILHEGRSQSQRRWDEPHPSLTCAPGLPGPDGPKASEVRTQAQEPLCPGPRQSRTTKSPHPQPPPPSRWEGG